VSRPHRALVGALAVTTAGVLPAYLLGAVAVQLQRDLALGEATLGLLVSLLFITAGLSGVPLGRLVDRIGWPAGVRVASVGSGCALLGVALLGRVAWVIGPLLVLGGLAHAVGAPAANTALARELPASRQGILFGLKQSSSSAALLLGGLAIPSVVALWGWRAAFLTAAAVPLLGWLSAPSDPGSPGKRRSRSGSVERPSGLLPVAVAGGAAAATVTATSTFLVVSAVAGGVAESAAGTLLAVGAVTSLLSRVGVGWHADQRNRRGLWAVAALLALGGVGLLAIATGGRWALVLGSALAFAAGAGWPGLYHLAVVHRHARVPAAATGTIQVGLSVGAAAGPFLFGLLVEATSFATAWGATAATAFTAAGLVAVAALRWRAADRVGLVGAGGRRGA
jgi:MFS family permease